VAIGGDYRFQPGAIFHAREAVPHGIRSNGHGYSRVLAAFVDSWNTATLHRTNTALGSDYLAPMRLLTMASNKTGSMYGSDPILNMDSRKITSFLQSLIRRHRMDPSTIGIVPFGVQYQVCGGDAKQYVPLDLLQDAEARQLNAYGVPLELHRNNLQVQAAPMALRLFEASQRPIIHMYNAFYAWLVDQQVVLRGWEPVRVTLRPPRYADNLELQVTTLQAAMQGDLPKQRAFGRIGEDWMTGQREIREEQKYIQSLDKKVQEEMQAEAMADQLRMSDMMQQGGGGAPPGPGMAGGGGGMPMGGDPSGMGQAALQGQIPAATQPISSEQAQQVAEALAQQLLQIPMQAQRDQQLDQIKTQNPMIHAFVLQALEKGRSQLRLQAGAQMGVG
jgi:hypothetical protein